jgi:hypothetical protein
MDFNDDEWMNNLVSRNNHGVSWTVRDHPLSSLTVTFSFVRHGWIDDSSIFLLFRPFLSVSQMLFFLFNQHKQSIRSAGSNIQDWVLRKKLLKQRWEEKCNPWLDRNVELTFFFCYYQFKINYFCESIVKIEHIKTLQFENLWKTILNVCSSLEVESWNLWIARFKTSQIR